MRTPARFAAIVLGAATPVVAACHGGNAPDAYGNFEAVEVVVSAETPGTLVQFQPVEGNVLTQGAAVALVDTTQLALQKQQSVAQRASTGAHTIEVEHQITVLRVQRDIARRTYERTRRLFDQHAATAQQLDQTERDYKTLGAQIQALEAQRRSVAQQAGSGAARVAQIAEQISRSRIMNPVTGTVLAVYAREGEFVQPGQPLYRIANLDTLDLRAYVTEDQLASFRIGSPVQVHVDRGDTAALTLPGRIAWVSAKAEFTPTPVQTRDERASLVYAIKVRVANPTGALKIGMPADLRLQNRPGGTMKGRAL